jgi:hypothetical protein
MRLIDADALKEKLFIADDNCNPVVTATEIDDAPTVEAKEVVHGEWKEATPKGVHSWSKWYARCSACDETIWSGWEMNFCPKCGADMRTSAE